ncbi:MAG: adenylate kinase family protein [Ignisphaera sp.]
MRSIGISGVPGTGKSQLAKRLSQYLGIEVVELSEFAIRNNYVIAYDDNRSSYIIDEERLSMAVEEMVKEKGPIIIVGHYIEIVPKNVLEVALVLRRNPLEIIKVLENRGWSPRKIAENVEAELVGICTANAIEEFGEDIVIEIDSTSKTVDDLAKEAIDIIFGDKPTYYGYSIDWTSKLSDEDLQTLLHFIEMYRE